MAEFLSRRRYLRQEGRATPFFVARLRAFRSISRIMDAAVLRAQELTSNAVEVGQAKERVHLREILRDPAVTYLRVPPQALHHQIRMLANGANSREAPVACLLRWSQRSSLGAAPV